MSSNQKTLQKPIACHRSAPAYDWVELQTYLEARLGFSVRDCNGKYSRTDLKPSERELLPHLDFWNFIANTYHVRDADYFKLEVREHRKPQHGFPQFVVELYEILDREFPEANGVLNCYFSG